MSTIGRQNFHARPSVADAVARLVLLDRQEDRFLDDQGIDVITPERAYEMAAEDWRFGRWARRGGRWVQLQDVAPVGVDCYAALEAGRIENEKRLERAASDFDAYCDNDWYECGPMDSVHMAFLEAEHDRWRQEDSMWSMEECGGFALDEVPVFMSRVRDGMNGPA